MRGKGRRVSGESGGVEVYDGGGKGISCLDSIRIAAPNVGDQIVNQRDDDDHVTA